MSQVVPGLQGSYFRLESASEHMPSSKLKVEARELNTLIITNTRTDARSCPTVYMFGKRVKVLINLRRACAARVTVVVLSV